MAGMTGTVYLLHFDRPYGPGGGTNGRGTARHYIGNAESSGFLKGWRQLSDAEFRETRVCLRRWHRGFLARSHWPGHQLPRSVTAAATAQAATSRPAGSSGRGGLDTSAAGPRRSR